MSNPTDGYGVYESINPTDANANARLCDIAAGGFSFVLNYNLLTNAHIADVQGYINYAAGLGLKVIAAFSNPAIWGSPNTIAASYPLLYADSGNQGTTAGFVTYIVNQIKGLSGLWGYYVGDEPLNTDHTNLKVMTDAVAAADASHPRLLSLGILTANTINPNFATFADCCEVFQQEFYPVGSSIVGTTITSTGAMAAAFQTVVTTNSKQCSWAIQAHSHGEYGGIDLYPSGDQMRYMRDQVVASLSTRIIMMYSYMDITAIPYPPTPPLGLRQWNSAQWAFNNVPFPIGADIAQHTTSAAAK